MSPCQQTKWQNPCSVRKFVPGVLSLRNFLRWARPIVLRLALVSSPRSSPTQQQIRQKMKGPRGPKPRNTIFRLLWPKRFSSSHLKGIKAKMLTMANISRSRLPCQFHRCPCFPTLSLQGRLDYVQCMSIHVTVDFLQRPNDSSSRSYKCAPAPVSLKLKPSPRVGM